MSQSVGEYIGHSKEALIGLSGDGFIAQSAGAIIDNFFELPQIETDLVESLPSIETFILSTDGTVMSTGSNEALNEAWMPAVQRLTEVVLAWADSNRVELVGDAYITASVTAADHVNGEAHFDDDQFDPTAGAGLVAVVGDIAGPSVASVPIPHEAVRPHGSLSADELQHPFASGDFGRTDYGANQLVVLPQFGQLHSGPGPCGEPGQVRHLMVFRAATTPNRETVSGSG